MEIERLIHISPEITELLGTLMMQLAPESKQLTQDYLQEVIDLPNVFLFLAKEQELIIGSFTLVLYKIPTGLKVSVEDVIVDTNMRGKKVGEKMILFAIEFAQKQLGATKIDLTSKPSRVAANALYQKLGFVKRDTNVYRFETSK